MSDPTDHDVLNDRLDRIERALDGLAEAVDDLAESLHPSVLKPDILEEMIGRDDTGPGRGVVG